MLKIKRDLNQQNFKIVHLYIVKSELISLTWSCESRERDNFKWFEIQNN